MATIAVADVTLREAELAPGVALDDAEKLRIAAALLDAGVSRIELGFPARSEHDRRAVRRIVAAHPSAPVCVLSSVDDQAIECSVSCLEAATAARLHLYAGGRGSQDARTLDVASAGVRNACRAVGDVAFSPLDATRLERSFLLQLIRRVVEAGATTINVADTLGVATPDDVRGLFMELTAAVPRDVVWSFHGHDDLGLATANAWAAILGGARQVEVSVSGLGPRAGNTSLEEVVEVVRLHGGSRGVATGVDPAALEPLAQMVSHATGVPLSAGSPIVGAWAKRPTLQSIGE